MADRSVVVIGAGPAGVRAAARLVEAGLRPIVVDEAARSGGQIYRRQPERFRRPLTELYGFETEKAVRLHREFDAIQPQIDYRPGTLAWNIYGGAVHLLEGSRTTALPFDALILATGATDRIMPMRGWTLPGVFSLGGAQIALKAQACAIGERCVFLGTGPLLYLVAHQYTNAGAQVEAVLDTSPFSGRLAAVSRLAMRPSMLAKGLYYIGSLMRRGVPLLTGVTPLAIEGAGCVSAISVRDQAGHERQFLCDAVGLGHGLRSETQLADLAGCSFAFDTVARQWLPETDVDGRSSRPGIYLAGDAVKALGADAAEFAGRLAACAVLTDFGSPPRTAEVNRLRRALKRMALFRAGLEQAFPWPAHLAATLSDNVLVCRCEAVTAGELRCATSYFGLSDVNRLKAISRFGMGRCQGRFCGPAAAELQCAILRVELQKVGRLRGQAPVKPIPVSAGPADGDVVV
jgi:NADPH-dependent 2,4-dienoyl-CoA reductase/sulfur reductase-like enzyme